MWMLINKFFQFLYFFIKNINKNNAKKKNVNIKNLEKLKVFMNKTHPLCRCSSLFTEKEKKIYRVGKLRRFLNKELYNILMDKIIEIDDYLYILLLCGCKDDIKDYLMQIEDIQLCLIKNKNNTVEKLNELNYFNGSIYHTYLNQSFIINAINNKNRDLLWALILLNYRIINDRMKEILLKYNVSFSLMTSDRYHESVTFLLPILIMDKTVRKPHDKNIKMIEELLKRFDITNEVHKYQLTLYYKNLDFNKLQNKNEDLIKFISEIKI